MLLLLLEVDQIYSADYSQIHNMNRGTLLQVLFEGYILKELCELAKWNLKNAK